MDGTYSWGGVMPYCTHVGTGCDLVSWMEENEVWPENPPVVHSMNPVGKDRMQRVIWKHYRRLGEYSDPTTKRYSVW